MFARHVLEKSSPKHLTLDTLMALEKMVKCITSGKCRKAQRDGERQKRQR